jgi:hypothetical protein
MPLIRKILNLRTSRGIILPKSWLEYYEQEYGQKITRVLHETDGQKIIVAIPKNFRFIVTKKERKK